MITYQLREGDMFHPDWGGLIIIVEQDKEYEGYWRCFSIAHKNILSYPASTLYQYKKVA